MSKGNPRPKLSFGKRNAAKSEVNLVAYGIRVHPTTIARIKELQALLSLKSQGEVVTKAVNILMEKSS